MLGDTQCENVWISKWLGQMFRGDGGQEEAVQHQLNVMQWKFNELRHLLLDKNTIIAWRLQYYVTGVLATALHNIGG